MSTIDSGLGWSCSSEYYVYDANTLLMTDRYSTSYYKANNGAAIAGQMLWDNGYSTGVIISTVADNVTTVPDAYSWGSIAVNGTTWYIMMQGYDSAPGATPVFPWYNENDPIAVPQTVTDAKRTEIVNVILTAANVQRVDSIASTDYVKAFVEGVEAETVTRVNALDTAKQPKTMSAAVSVGGVSQSTVEGAIGAMAAKISKIDFDIHRNLGTEITAAQKLAIANGTFEDLPIGAYWTLNNTVYRIAHHDYYLGTGDTACASHHIVVVPDNNMYSAKMNDTDTAEGGYAGSKMRTTNLATALSTFETDFGAAHILNHRIQITNAVSNGQASGWSWTDSKVELMSENMACGHPVWGLSGFETGIERGQLVLFSIYPEYIQKQRS